MSIGIWELALILLFLVVAAGVVALITRVSHGKDVSHHTAWSSLAKHDDEIR